MGLIALRNGEGDKPRGAVEGGMVNFLYDESTSATQDKGLKLKGLNQPRWGHENGAKDLLLGISASHWG